jgi:hypothetical protein
MREPRNEDPSTEDITRFGDDGSQVGWCPECGEDVWDEADSCPACGEWIAGTVLRRPPAAQAFQHRLMIIITVVTLIVFIFVFAL